MCQVSMKRVNCHKINHVNMGDEVKNLTNCEKYNMRHQLNTNCICNIHRIYKLLVAVFTLNLFILSVSTSQIHNHHRRQSNSDVAQNKNCTRCSLMLEDAKNRRIEEFKREFLHKLGLKEEPKFNFIDKSLYNIPPLIHSYDTLTADDRWSNRLTGDEGMLGDAPYNYHSPPQLANDIDDSPNIKKIISFAKPPPEALNISDDWNAQYFQFSPSILNLYISRATLWVNVRKPSHGSDIRGDDDDDEETDIYSSSHHNGAGSGIENQFQNRHKARAAAAANEKNNNYGWIVIDQVRPYNVDGETGQSLFHVRSRKVPITSGTSWVKLKVKKLVSQWIHAPKENLGLVIHVYDSEGRILPIGSAGSVKYESLQLPFIEMRMDPQSQNRFKRRASENFCDINKSEDQLGCCLYPFTVDFKAFGWNWILAPESYQANYCTGECEEFDTGSYSHIMKQAKGSHSRCCVPKKTSPLQILYVTPKGDVYSQSIPDMRIEKCGCA